MGCVGSMCSIHKSPVCLKLFYNENRITGLLVSGLAPMRLERITSVLRIRKTLKKMNINSSSKIHQRIEVTGQNAVLINEETGRYRKITFFFS